MKSLEKDMRRYPLPIMYRAKRGARTQSFVKDVFVHFGQGGTLSFLPRVTLVPQLVQL